MSQNPEDILAASIMSAGLTDSEDFFNFTLDGSEDAEVERAVDEFFPNLEKIMDSNPNEDNGMTTVEGITDTNPNEDDGMTTVEGITDTNLNEDKDMMTTVEDIPETIADEDEDNQIMMTTMSPTEVCAEKPESKRGRKRKYTEDERPGTARRQQKKTKAYEQGPLDDPVAEKKRQNAQNAKRHRDLQKKLTEELHNSLHQVSNERDELKRQVEMFQRRADSLQAELDSYQAISSNFLN